MLRISAFLMVLAIGCGGTGKPPEVTSSVILRFTNTTAETLYVDASGPFNLSSAIHQVPMCGTVCGECDLSRACGFTAIRIAPTVRQIDPGESIDQTFSGLVWDIEAKGCGMDDCQSWRTGARGITASITFSRTYQPACPEASCPGGFGDKSWEGTLTGDPGISTTKFDYPGPAIVTLR